MGLTGLATFGYNIGDVLQDWEALGIFSYVLPAILIFAVIFALLENIPVFKDRKGINMIIGLSVALLALQFNFVPMFFAEIFPRVGIGLAVVLAALILSGAFIDWEAKSGAFRWIFFGIGALTFLLVIANAFSSFSLFGSGWWQQYGSALIILIVIIAMIVAVMVGSGKGKGSTGG